VPTKIIYCYGIYQKEFEQMLQLIPNLTLVEGFPDNLCEMTRGHDNLLVMLDNLMPQCSNDPRVSDLFTRNSHHLGMSVLYLTQNLFPPGERSRTISLNSNILIVLETHVTRLVFPHLSAICSLNIPNTFWMHFTMRRARTLWVFSHRLLLLSGTSKTD
jgi:hypothetical protein